MAEIVEKKLVDDIDGSEAVDTVEFSIEGKSLVIDLSEDNAQRLRDFLEEFVTAARPSGRRSPEETARIRTWAREAGYEVSARGRLDEKIITAYYEQS